MNIYLEFKKKDGSFDSIFIITVCYRHYNDYSVMIWLSQQLNENDCCEDYLQYKEPTSGNCDICMNHGDVQ